MKINLAGQSIGVQMITASDGTNFTGSVSVSVTIDNGTQTAGAGTAPAHEGNGYHSYSPTQAETNGDHIAFTFTGTGAITATVQVYTDFPQTGDNFIRLGAPSGASVSADIADVPTVAEFNARTILSASYFDPSVDNVIVGTNNDKTGYSISGTKTTLDALNDIAATSIVSAGAITTLSGAIVNVDTVDTCSTNTDMRGTDSALLASSAPTNFGSMVISVGGATDSLVQGYLNTAISETTAGNIAANFDNFYDNSNALTTKIVDDVGGAGGGGTDWTSSERNEIRGRLGLTGTTAAGGNTPTLALQSAIDALNNFDPATELVNITQAGADKVWTSSSRTLTSFSFTVNCDVKQINGTTVIGNGTAANLWRA